MKIEPATYFLRFLIIRKQIKLHQDTNFDYTLKMGNDKFKSTDLYQKNYIWEREGMELCISSTPTCFTQQTKPICSILLKHPQIQTPKLAKEVF